MKVARGTARKLRRAAARAAGKFGGGGNEGVTLFRMAEAKYERQKRRYFSGVVGSWKSPWDMGRDGSAFCNPSFARAREAFGEALVALSQEQVWKYVDRLSPDEIQARAQERKRRRVADFVQAEEVA